MSRLVLVSNRLPVTLSRGRVEQSSGGLVAALGPLHEQRSGLWVGSLGKSAVPPAVLEQELERRRWVSVPARSRDARRHYEGFSNGVLWPLLHYLPGHVRFDWRDLEAYRRVNERFAEVIASRACAHDSIWVHDYHLMLLPALLRERLPEARIGFFVHVPFPSSDVYRILPVAEELLRGLLGADLIGLHTMTTPGTW